jgi:hypothetical protein
MTKDDIWNLFVQTGNISYYLKYKETKGFENYGNNKSERDNNKRKTI